VVATLRFRTDSSYYLRERLHGAELQLAATWYAPSGSFGLKDGEAVDPDTFKRLHAGLGPDGLSLLTTRGRQVGAIDLTFSAPKDLSVAYGLAANQDLRQSILAAHNNAVRAALTLFDSEAIFARRGRGGAILEPVSLSAAVFPHDCARPSLHADGAVHADCQVHSHCACLSLAVRGDGTVGCVDTRQGWHVRMVGSVYHAHCAHNLLQLGFHVTEAEFGSFSLGFDPRLRSEFSGRRSEILAAARRDARGALTPRATAAAALSTRRPKPETAGEDRFELWRDRARARGFDPDRLIEERRHRRDLEPAGADEFRRRLDALQQELQSGPLPPRRQLIRAVATACIGTSVDPSCIIAETDWLINAAACEAGLRRTGLERNSATAFIEPEPVETDETPCAFM
jgi:conjugative relaxase-like TrwC/TraI family protein